MFAKKVTAVAENRDNSERGFVSQLDVVRQRANERSLVKDSDKGQISPSKAAARADLSKRGRVLDTWKDLCRTNMVLELHVTDCRLPGGETLNLANASMGKNYTDTLSSLVAHEDMAHVRILDLTDNRMDPNMASSVISSLQSAVRVLVLDKNKLGKKGCAALEEFVKRNATALEALSLNKCDAGDGAAASVVKTLATSLPGNEGQANLPHHLLSLRLGGNGLGTESGLAVGALLAHPDCQIKVLALEWNDLQVEGSAAVLRGAAMGRSLMCLNMEFCGVAEGNITHVARLMQAYIQVCQMPDADQETDEGGGEPLLRLSLTDNPIPSILMDNLLETLQSGKQGYPVELLFTPNQLQPSADMLRSAASKSAASSGGSASGIKPPARGHDGKINERTGFRSTPTKAEGKGGKGS